MKSCAFLICWLLCCRVSSAQEEKIYRASTLQIPLFIEDEEHGVFIEVFQEVVKRVGERVELIISSGNRSKKMFCDGDVDIYFPALENSLTCSFVSSAPFYRKEEIVFVPEGSPIISDIAQLEGKLVGVTKGYSYGAGLVSNSKIDLDYADSDVLNMRKLSKGRIQAFVVETQSGLKALQESGVTNVAYDVKKPLSARATYFAFHETDEGRALAEKFSNAIEAMISDGTLQTILNNTQ
ncbi:amino acid ABC transporter, periplasmic [Candidatus Moduliflexus flocculans]|uniref:Amino acid ABC transporter, periplasmic n=1 Tax=Candidatus Moduliflexus flocculans TaxID=1499966 RepID=A0A081BT12_9BACT|nr:amino acid ABC transporter, periplasmic [Candidatus Moduliflexus flocculans]